MYHDDRHTRHPRKCHSRLYICPRGVPVQTLHGWRGIRIANTEHQVMECTSEDAAVIDMINDMDGDDDQKKKAKITSTGKKKKFRCGESNPDLLGFELKTSDASRYTTTDVHVLWLSLALHQGPILWSKWSTYSRIRDALDIHIVVDYMLSNYAPPINSHPFRTTPTKPPVCMVSDPPPASRHSISASPSSHVILVCAGTSSCCSCSARAERISARARPLLALIVSRVLRQDVTSLVESNVDMISWISDGCGAAMQSYIVSFVTTSGSGRGWSLGAFFNGSGIPELKFGE